MNPMTNIKNVLKLSEQELRLGGKSSWHDQYKGSAWVFIGGLPYDLTEGDVICMFSQYGEVVNINLVRDKHTGKAKGFCFLCYEDQRSTILAVDNLNGIQLLNRTIRVDHVSEYKVPKEAKHTDDITRSLYNHGCAPNPSERKPEPVEKEKSSSEEDSSSKSKKKKRKKHKKKHSKKRRRASSSDSSSSAEHTKTHSNDSDVDIKPNLKCIPRFGMDYAPSAIVKADVPDVKPSLESIQNVIVKEEPDTDSDTPKDKHARKISPVQSRTSDRERSRSPKSSRNRKQSRSPKSSRNRKQSRSPKSSRNRERSPPPKSSRNREQSRSPKSSRACERSRSPKTSRNRERSPPLKNKRNHSRSRSKGRHDSKRDRHSK